MDLFEYSLRAVDGRLVLYLGETPLAKLSDTNTGWRWLALAAASLSLLGAEVAGEIRKFLGPP